MFFGISVSGSFGHTQSRAGTSARTPGKAHAGTGGSGGPLSPRPGSSVKGTQHEGQLSGGVVWGPLSLLGSPWGLWVKTTVTAVPRPPLPHPRSLRDARGVLRRLAEGHATFLLTVLLTRSGVSKLSPPSSRTQQTSKCVMLVSSIPSQPEGTRDPRDGDPQGQKHNGPPLWRAWTDASLPPRPLPG